MAILIMLFYMEDRWAYPIGVLAPLVWFGLSFETGLPGAALRQILRWGLGQEIGNIEEHFAGNYGHFERFDDGGCVRRWMKEYGGPGDDPRNDRQN